MYSFPYWIQLQLENNLKRLERNYIILKIVYGGQKLELAAQIDTSFTGVLWEVGQSYEPTRNDTHSHKSRFLLVVG